MPIAQDKLEDAIRQAIPVSFLEITDTSNGCGENYSVVVVSEVSLVRASTICMD
jgi:stress-induced morphogen